MCDDLREASGFRRQIIGGEEVAAGVWGFAGAPRDQRNVREAIGATLAHGRYRVVRSKERDASYFWDIYINKSGNVTGVSAMFF